MPPIAPSWTARPFRRRRVVAVAEAGGRVSFLSRATRHASITRFTPGTSTANGRSQKTCRPGVDRRPQVQRPEVRRRGQQDDVGVFESPLRTRRSRRTSGRPGRRPAADGGRFERVEPRRGCGRTRRPRRRAVAVRVGGEGVDDRPAAPAAAADEADADGVEAGGAGAAGSFIAFIVPARDRRLPASRAPEGNGEGGTWAK